MYIDDENETKHLQALEEYKSQRLRLFQIDLLDYDSIVKAITGVTGVFHLASPCTVDKIHDPEVWFRIFHIYTHLSMQKFEYGRSVEPQCMSTG